MDSRIGIRKAGNQGLVASTAGNDLLHDLPIGRTAKIRKIMAFNPLAVNVNLQFGTLNLTPAFVPLFPILVALPGLDNEWLEEEIPDVEWAQLVDAVAAVALVGDIYLLAAAATVVVQITVEEFGT